MKKIYYDVDCNIETLKNDTIAVIGYGSQGHAQAQNMKDSGLHVIIGLHKNSASIEKAKADGFEVYPVNEASKKATVIEILIPDTIQPKIYKEQIEPHLSDGKALVFSHGFNIHFDLIAPEKKVDVYMIAPKSPGHLLRRMYVEKKGVPSLIAIHQNYTGRAKERALAHAGAIGSGKAGIFETTFQEETETDLFGEQVVLCGGVTSLIKNSFETLVEAGYAPEIAYFECLHELKLIVDLINEGGLEGMRYSISDTAEYGDLTRGHRVVDSHVKNNMQKILNEIQKSKGASFAKEWVKESKNGYPNFHRRRMEEKQHPIEKVGRKLRSMMTWLR